jgi:signal transduction histidine kinase
MVGPAWAGVLVAMFCLLCALAPDRAAALPTLPTITALAVLDGPEADVPVAAALRLSREGRFRPLPEKRYAAPGDGVFWLRLTIDAPAGTDQDAYAVDLNWPFLRLVESFEADGTKSFAAGEGAWNFYLPEDVPLPPDAPGPATLYLRVAGYGGANINPSLVSLAAAARLEALRPWVLGFFFGLMAAMLLYNLFLSFSLRDASYGYYVISTAFLGLYFCCTTGLAPSWLEVRTEAQALRFFLAFHANAALMFASMGLFTRSFLLTKTTSPGIDRLLLGQVAAALLLLPVVLFGGSAPAFAYGPMVGMATAVAVSLAAVVRFAQGFRPAGVFLVGWGFYVACGFTHSMTWAGLIPATLLTIHAPLAGTAVEVLVMSLALAYRVKLLREQAAQAEEQRRLLAEEKSRSEKARDDLARENALLSMILDDRRFGIGMCRDGRFCFANRQLARHLDCDDLTGRPLAAVPGALALLDNVLAAAGDGNESETVIGQPGCGRTLRAVGRPLDPSCPQRGTVFIVEDISEAKRLEQLRNDLDQVMRHDLKSPLATIAGILEGIEIAGPLTERQRRLTAMLERTVADMASRINLSLALYKLEAGSFAPVCEPLPLAGLLEAAKAELAPYLIAGSRLDIVYEAPPQAFVVAGQRTLVTALLVNLLKNALEAATAAAAGGAAGPVLVTVADPAGPRLAIDNPGEVPPEVRGRFFEKYATAGKSGGTGLGAYAARLMARAFGGEVTVDMSRPGRTLVTVRLPAA